MPSNGMSNHHHAMKTIDDAVISTQVAALTTVTVVSGSCKNGCYLIKHVYFKSKNKTLLYFRITSTNISQYY